VLIAVNRTDTVSDFMYSIRASLMTLQFSSEWALEARAAMAWIAGEDLKDRVSCDRRGRMILSNRVGEDQYATISLVALQKYNLA